MVPALGWPELYICIYVYCIYVYMYIFVYVYMCICIHRYDSVCVLGDLLAKYIVHTPCLFGHGQPTHEYYSSSRFVVPGKAHTHTHTHTKIHTHNLHRGHSNTTIACMQHAMSRVGQNHTYICIYGVDTVISAGKVPYIQSTTVYINGSGQP